MLNTPYRTASKPYEKPRKVRFDIPWVAIIAGTLYYILFGIWLISSGLGHWPSLIVVAAILGLHNFLLIREEREE